MTRISFFFIAFLILGNPAVVANAVDQHAELFTIVLQSGSFESAPAESGHLQPEWATPGFGLMMDHGSHSSSKFHHEEDGKAHGFSFEKWDRHRGLRQIGCACLKCILILLHLTIILVAFMHQIH
jgi:hypothetical protein